MGRTRLEPRIQLRNGRHILVYFDEETLKTVRRSCAALGAHTDAQRKVLLKRTKIEQARKRAERFQRGGAVGFDTNLIRAIEAYLKDVDQTRSSGRKTLKPASLVQLKASLNRFLAWLKASRRDRLETGQLDAKTLRAYFVYLSEPQDEHRALKPATVDKHRRNIKTCLTALDEEHPPLFRNFKAIKKGLIQEAGHVANPRAHSPAQLQQMYVQLSELDGDDGYQARMFLLLALTGARLGDVLELKWQEVNSEDGVLLLSNRKQHNDSKRKVSLASPITHASSVMLAPRFAERLRNWKGDAADEAFVLNGSIEVEPRLNRYRWEKAAKVAELPGFTRHDLRRNFTSFAASLGIPASVAAMIQGHSASIAEKHYREQLTPESKASTMEDAMGLTEFIKGA